MAVCCKNLRLERGFRASKRTVLDGVTLRCDAGAVYGLLGPSGCGKTSLLYCVVGMLKPNEGQVLVDGRPPGTVDLGLPGHLAGYMPQDIALHKYFTPREVLRYYGVVFGSDGLDERIDHLVGLLGLANDGADKRRIGLLSGGQKRRVSLACALVHSPKLLVL